MPKIFKFTFVLVLFIFGGGCSTTSSSVSARRFQDFKIRKITERGLETVTVRDARAEWPELQSGEAVPLKVNSQNIRIAVLGDTGCRLKEWPGGGAYQNCRNGSDWVFPQLAQSVERENYELLIHTGDYHYREHCSRAECAEITESVGYNWATWWDDFYGPAQGLLKKTPWLTMRGNHEDCERAHAGWAPLSAIRSGFTGACESIEPYQWIEMGDLVFINFDNADFEDRLPMNEMLRQKWLPHLQAISKRIGAAKQRGGAEKEFWLLAHIPAYAFVPDLKTAEPVAITDNFSSLLKASGLLKKIDYILSGHIHNQQIVPRSSAPLQLIVGNSGTALDAFGRILNTSKVISTTDTRQSYGYTLLERQGLRDWKIVLKDTGGDTVMSCSVKAHRVFCE